MIIIQKHLETYGKDMPTVNNNGNFVEFNGTNATYSFKFKV